MARRKPATVHGLLAIDKPAGITSHDVVDRVRRLLHERKVGHSGTLDPDATGVLLLGVGDATRLLRYLDVVPGGTVESPVTSKAYTAEVVLGTETSTLDASGKVTATHDMSEVVTGLTIESLQRVVDANLSGPIMQVPPMVSALKVDGKGLHELAREGVEVERQARPVTVHHFAVEPTSDKSVFRIDVTVSSGTYVRSLAADLGTALGGGAHLRKLRRHSIGPYDERESGSIDNAPLLPPLEALRLAKQVTVDAETARLVANGRRLPKFEGNGPWALVDERGALIGVYELIENEAVPAVVLAEPVS